MGTGVILSTLLDCRVKDKMASSSDDACLPQGCSCRPSHAEMRHKKCARVWLPFDTRRVEATLCYCWDYEGLCWDATDDLDVHALFDARGNLKSVCSQCALEYLRSVDEIPKVECEELTAE